MQIYDSLKDFSTLQYKAFSAIWLIYLENWLDFHANFTRDVSLDNEVSIKFWKSFAVGFDPDPIKAWRRSIAALLECSCCRL